MEKPDAPVTCCGAYQPDERHFVWDETANEWRCGKSRTEPQPEPVVKPSPRRGRPKKGSK